MSVSSKLLAAEWAYIALSVCVVIYWLFEVYRTAVARQLAPLLRDELVRTTCRSRKGGGREAMAQLLNDLDHAIRSNPRASTQELERLVIALSVAHLLRVSDGDSSALQHWLNSRDADVMSAEKIEKRRMISTDSLATYFRPGSVSRFRLHCLKIRLWQDWDEISSLYLKRTTQPT